MRRRKGERGGGGRGGGGGRHGRNQCNTYTNMIQSPR